MNYDDYVTGQFQSWSPINQEPVEMTELELLQEELIEMRKQVRECRELIKQMEAVELGDLFFITTDDERKTDEYLKLKQRLYFKVKYKI